MITPLCLDEKCQEIPWGSLPGRVQRSALYLDAGGRCASHRGARARDVACQTRTRATRITPERVRPASVSVRLGAARCIIGGDGIVLLHLTTLAAY